MVPSNMFVPFIFGSFGLKGFWSDLLTGLAAKKNAAVSGMDISSKLGGVSVFCFFWGGRDVGLQGPRFHFFLGYGVELDLSKSTCHMIECSSSKSK